MRIDIFTSVGLHVNPTFSGAFRSIYWILTLLAW